MILYPALRKPYKVTQENRTIVVILIFIYIIFSFWGDWFHYNRDVILIKNGWETNLEDIYKWLINNICFHYLVFRILIWGTAFLLLWKTARNLHINIDLVLLFLGCGWMTLFAYARVTLAMSILYYGFSLLYINNRNSILYHILGILLICGSFFFHKTALFGIAMILLGFIGSKVNSKFLVGILLLTPLLIGIVSNYLFQFVISEFDSSNTLIQQSSAAGKEYLQNDSEDSGLGAMIRSFFEYSSYYLMAFICLFSILSNRNKIHISNAIKTLSTICLLTIASASIFAFDLGLNTKVIYVRFLRFSVIPIILLMAYFYQNSCYKKTVKLIFIVTCCMTVYATLYTMYLCRVGVDLIGN